MELSNGAAASGWACTLPGGQPLSGTVTGGEFEAGCSALFDSAVAPVHAALDVANLAPGEVDEVVLVGGSSRLPGVRQRLARVLGGAGMRHSLDPDLAVALGAASVVD